MARTVVGLFYGARVSEDQADFFEHQVSEDIDILYTHDPKLIGYWVVRNLLDSAGCSIDELRSVPAAKEVEAMWLSFVDRWSGSDHPAPTSPRLYIAARRE